MDADRQAYSGSQIICAECEARAEGAGARNAGYLCDGISVWRREANERAGRGAVVARTATRGGRRR